VIPVLLVRWLSQDEFGRYKQAFLVVATAQKVLQLGFANAAFYYLPRERDRRSSIVCNILIFNLVLGAVVWLTPALYPESLKLIVGDEGLSPVASLIGFVTAIWIFSEFLEIVATAHQDTRYSTIFIVGAQLTRSGFLVGATLLRPSVSGLLWAAGLQGVLQTAVLLWYLHSRFPGFWLKSDWRTFREQFSYAIPLGVAGLLYTMQTDLHKFFVAHAVDTSTFAIYAIGCTQLPLVALLRASVGSVMIPRVSLLEQQGRRVEITRVLTSAARKVSAFYWPIYFYFLVTGREFIIVLFTRSYLDAWPIFAVNLTLVPMEIVLLDPVFRAYKESRFFLLWTRAVIAIALVGALYLVTPRFGMIGAIAAAVSVTLAERIAHSWKVVRILRIGRGQLGQLLDVVKLGMAAAAAGVAAWLVRGALLENHPIVILLVCGLVFASIYVIGAVRLGVPTAEEAEMFRARFSSLCSRVLAVTNPRPRIGRNE